MYTVVIIPEPHIWDKDFTTVPEYSVECRKNMQMVYDILASVENPVALFVGDVFHRGFSTYEGGQYWEKYFYEVYTLTAGRVYSVVGNHEFTYQKSNPFWHFATINSDFVSFRVKSKDPSTCMNFIQIEDGICIENVMFIFAHYGMNLNDITVPDNIKSVVLCSHNTLISEEITNNLNNVYGRDMNTAYLKPVSIRTPGALPRTEKLKHVYVGHMHKAFGKYAVCEEINGIKYSFELTNLGSLGRTNATEYNDNDLSRVIPIIKIDGDITSEESRVITLSSRKSVVSEDAVVHGKEKYRGQQTIRELKTLSLEIDDTIGSIKSYLEDKPEMAELFTSSLDCTLPYELTQLLEM